MDHQNDPSRLHEYRTEPGESNRITDEADPNSDSAASPPTLIFKKKRPRPKAKSRGISLLADEKVRLDTSAYLEAEEDDEEEVNERLLALRELQKSRSLVRQSANIHTSRSNTIIVLGKDSDFGELGPSTDRDSLNAGLCAHFKSEQVINEVTNKRMEDYISSKLAVETETGGNRKEEIEEEDANLFAIPEKYASIKSVPYDPNRSLPGSGFEEVVLGKPFKARQASINKISK